jgi:hypothetical protein
MKLNLDAYKQAESLILQAKVDMLSAWSSAKPSHKASEEFLAKHNKEHYDKWFLGIDPSKEGSSEESLNFLYGDFEKVYRSALVAIKEIAEQHQYADIATGVKELLRQIDKEPDAVDIASEESFPASDPPPH